MTFRLRRRRFGQLAIATTIASAVTSLTTKSQAQQPPLVIYGVKIGNIGSSGTSQTSITNRVNQTVLNQVPDIAIQPDLNQVADITKIANVSPKTTLISSALNTSQNTLTQIPALTVNNLNQSTEAVPKALYIPSSQRVTGLTVQINGTLLTATVTSSRLGEVSHLIYTTPNNSSQKSLTVSGFSKRNGTVESLLVTNDGNILSIVSLNEGSPPFELVEIDPNSGKVISGAQLGLPDIKSYQRYSNLAQSQDGRIFATNLTSQGVTRLVQLDLNNKSVLTGRGKIIPLSPLSFNKKPLENDLQSLAFSPSGQLFALADPTNTGVNSLFTVNINTGELSLLREFNVDKLAFPRA